jgi:sialate O-acetylesterase
VLQSPEVHQPCAIRYAWSKLAGPNLRNAEGFPVSAFRCGQLPERAMVDRLVPQAKGYELLYSHDIGSGGTSQNAAAYRVDRAKEVGAFDRVAYFLVLQKDGGPIQYVWASMKPFTTDARRLGIPTVSTQANFHQAVEDMEVLTNVDGVTTGEGMTGYIEFWPSNYGPENTGQVKGASDEAFDFGDTPGTTVAGYGSMQIHNPSAKQTVMALNRWWDAAIDVGIGNSPEGNPDYTFRGNAGQYRIKRLMVLVRPVK